MSDTYKVLGQVKPAANTLTTLYTVPAAMNAVCSSLSICNVTGTAGSSDTVRVSISVGGAADALSQYVYYDLNLTKQQNLVEVAGRALNAGDVVRVFSLNGNVSFTLHGDEIDPAQPPPLTGTNGQILEYIAAILTPYTRPYGEMTMQDNATATTISVAGTPANMAGTAVAGALSFFTFTGASNKLTYTGAATRKFLVTGNVEIIGPAAAEVTVQIALNGSVLAATENSSKISDPGTPGALGVPGAKNNPCISFQGIVSLAMNDFLQIFVGNDTSAANITVQMAQLAAVEIGV